MRCDGRLEGLFCFSFFYSKGMWNRFKINFILSFETAWFDIMKILSVCPTLLLKSLWTIQHWCFIFFFLYCFLYPLFTLSITISLADFFSNNSPEKFFCNKTPEFFFAINLQKTFCWLLLSAGLKEILTSCSADNRLAMMKIKKGEWSGVEWSGSLQLLRWIVLQTNWMTCLFHFHRNRGF